MSQRRSKRAAATAKALGDDDSAGDEPAAGAAAAVRGPIKACHVNVSALVPFTGQLIIPPDGQIKAATVRFLAGSTLPGCTGNAARVFPDDAHPSEAAYSRAARHVPILASPDMDSAAPSRALLLQRDIAAALTDAAANDAAAASDAAVPAFSAGVTPPAASRASVTFNKMSGMQELANCVALYVNLDMSTYANLFVADRSLARAAAAHAGVEPDEFAAPTLMTFYAQASHSRDSRLIVRMAAARQDTALVSRQAAAPAAATAVAAEVGAAAGAGAATGADAATGAGVAAGAGAAAGSGTAATVPVPVAVQAGLALGGALGRALEAEARIQARLAAAADDNSNDDDADADADAGAPLTSPPLDATLLFCRLPGGFYRYCGRLRLLACTGPDPDRARGHASATEGLIRFVYQLQDDGALGPLRQELRGLAPEDFPKGIRDFDGEDPKSNGPVKKPA
jgi:hypothetical protein